MGCSVRAYMFVGFTFDKVAKIVKNKQEKFVTKYEEDTGKPYQKDVSEYTYSLEVFGKEIPFDGEHDSFYDVKEAIENNFKESNINVSYGDGENISASLIGVRLVKTDDLMYGGGDYEVSLDRILEAVESLKVHAENPSVFLGTTVSC